MACLLLKVATSWIVEEFDMAYFIMIRAPGDAWDWSIPMNQQVQWQAHAEFMNALANEGFIAAGGPLGKEDDAVQILHILNAPSDMGAASIEGMMAKDPWVPMGLLKTVSIQPWNVLLGGFDCPDCGMVFHRPKSE